VPGTPEACFPVFECPDISMVLCIQNSSLKIPSMHSTLSQGAIIPFALLRTERMQNDATIP